MRKFLINVNGNEYEVEVEEIVDGKASTPSGPRPGAKVGKPASPAPGPKGPKAEKKEVVVSEGSELVSAPMPGTILSVNVNEGDQVKAGDILLILEAMKMENEILAPKDGKISSIGVSQGTSVNTGDKLVVID